MKKLIFITAFIICGIFMTQNLFAGITVVSVEGEAAYRDERAGRWVQLQAGATLQEGVRISTGVKSSLTLNVSGNRVVLGPLTMMVVQENQLISGTQSTQINMRRGEMVADVTQGEKIRSVFRVSTPVVTSAVRGTTKKITTGPSGTLMTATEGSVRVDSKNGQKRVLSGRLALNQPKGSMEPKTLLTSSVPSVSATGLVEREQIAEELFQENPRLDLQIDNIINEGRVDLNIYFPNGGK